MQMSPNVRKKMHFMTRLLYSRIYSLDINTNAKTFGKLEILLEVVNEIHETEAQELWGNTFKAFDQHKT